MAESKKQKARRLSLRNDKSNIRLDIRKTQKDLMAIKKEIGSIGSILSTADHYVLEKDLTKAISMMSTLISQNRIYKLKADLVKLRNDIQNKNIALVDNVQ